MNSFNKQRMPKWSSVNAEVMTEGDNLQELGKTQKNPMGALQTMPISFGHFPSENPPTFLAQELRKIYNL